jgi:hypothetical protein
MVENRRFEIVGDIIRGHRSDLWQRNRIGRAADGSNSALARFFMRRAGATVANGMPRRLASRTPVFHCPPTLHCSKYWALVLDMFSH